MADEQTGALPLEGGSGSKKWTLADGIAEVKRELMLRERVYAHRVQTKAMSQHEADHHMAQMQGVLRFLEFCLKKEAALRQALAEYLAKEEG